MQTTNSRILFGEKWFSLRRCLAMMVGLLGASCVSAFCLLLAFGIGATPAAASAMPSRIVATADLDLDDAADISRLNRRIVRAAREVCATADERAYMVYRGTDPCVARATASGKHQAAAIVARRALASTGTFTGGR